MAADVKRQFARKVPPPKEKIDPVKANRTLDALTRPPPPPPLSNYDRIIAKTYDEVMSRSKSSSTGARSGKTIPQLSEQENQSCPPLKVFTDTPGVAAVAPSFTPGDYLGDDVQFEIAKVDTFKYQHGKRLVRSDDLERDLPTMMRRLHKWYLETCKDGTGSILVGIKDEHDFIGIDSIYVEFDELFQLYNQAALDKSLISCYCP